MVEAVYMERNNVIVAGREYVSQAGKCSGLWIGTSCQERTHIAAFANGQRILFEIRTASSTEEGERQRLANPIVPSMLYLVVCCDGRRDGIEFAFVDASIYPVAVGYGYM